jgi:hypothetical protein
LYPLPAEHIDLSQWSRARVNINYHIAFDTNYYSVPYNLVHDLVEVRSTPTTIEIFNKGQRGASHLRARGHGHTATIANTARGPTRLIWNVRPRAWCIGHCPLVRSISAIQSRRHFRLFRIEAKLASTALAYSTYLGGSGLDLCKQPMDRKAADDASSRHGRGIEDPGTRSFRA